MKVGELKNLLDGLSDDFDVTVMVIEKIPEDERDPIYPYPSSALDFNIDDADISCSEKKVCLHIHYDNPIG